MKGPDWRAVWSGRLGNTAMGQMHPTRAQHCGDMGSGCGADAGSDTDVDDDTDAGCFQLRG